MISFPLDRLTFSTSRLLPPALPHERDVQYNECAGPHVRSDMTEFHS